MSQFQIGVGLMACQQSVGINGIGFYTAETFVAAGKWQESEEPVSSVCHIYFSSTVEFAGLSSGKAGTVAYACMQVVYPSTSF